MEMPKAYDKDALVKGLEQVGIVGGIETAKKAMNVLEDWLVSSADMSTEGVVGKIDDFIKPGVKLVAKLVNDKLSEIEAKLVSSEPAPAVEEPKAEEPKAEEPKIEEPGA